MVYSRHNILHNVRKEDVGEIKRLHGYDIT